MSELVAVALITGGLSGGLALAGSLGAQWLGGRNEGKRAHLQFQADLKAKLMDYEREDRLALVRPLREYLAELGEAFGAATETGADRQAIAMAWSTNIVAQLLRGTILRHSIDDDEVCASMDKLLAAVREFAAAAGDVLKAPSGSAEEREAAARLSGIELQPLTRDVHAKLDRYARRVDIPRLDD